MCIYIYIYVCVYVYTHTCTYIHICKFIHYILYWSSPIGLASLPGRSVAAQGLDGGPAEGSGALADQGPFGRSSVLNLYLVPVLNQIEVP